MTKIQQLWLRIGLLTLLVGIMLAGFSNVANAQDDANTKIYFQMDGDIWSFTISTGQFVQESTWEHNEEPVMSPDGTRFAYLSLSAVAVNALNNNIPVFDPQPNNVWIWDLDVNDAYRLADQPANASISLTQNQNIIGRTSLAWSPDGTQLAWLEAGTDYTFRLVIHSFTTNTSRIVPAQIPFPFGDAGFIARHKMAWGAGGIALLNISVGNGGQFQLEDSLHVYDPNTGNLRWQHVVSSGETRIVHYYWIDAASIGLHFSDGGHGTLDLNNGNILPKPTTLVYSISAPNNNFAVLVGGKSQDQYRFDIGATGQDFFANGLDGFVAISPSGNSVVYASDAVYILTNGNTMRITGSEGVADEFRVGLTWGATAMRPVNTPVSVNPCANTPTTRLVVGNNGYVLPGLGDNVLRDAPGLSATGSNEIGLIPPNGEFTVLDGPRCVSGHHWWHVNFNGQLGWTAEADTDGATYWLAPR